MLSILAIFLMIAVQTQDMETQLLQALQSGDIQKVRALLEAGANLNARSEHGMSALCIAIDVGHPREELVRLLLEAGANASLRNKGSKTALDIANEKGHANVVQILLRVRRE